MNKRLEVAAILAASRKYPAYDFMSSASLTTQRADWAREQLEFADALIKEEERTRSKFNG